MSAPEPPIDAPDATLSLRPASETDWPLLSRWLRQPDIVAWWGPAASTEAEIRIALDTPTAICCIIEWDGAAVGYAHAVDARVWGADLPDDLEPGTWDLDVFIASAVHRGRGMGAAALAELRDEVFATTLALAVAVFPSIENEGAVRDYERAGFRAKRVWRDNAYGPSWFMIAERPVAA